MNERKYPWRDHWGVHTLGTLREYAAQVIDTGWFYSWYWGNKAGEDWREAALKDCRSRIQSVRSELHALEKCELALQADIKEHPHEA